jgi:tetratricopeptide (TPR) repeat protein
MESGSTLQLVSDFAFRLAQNPLARFAFACAVGLFFASFALRESGAKIRRAYFMALVCLVIGGGGTLAVVSAKSSPEKVAAASPRKPKPAEKLDPWMEARLARDAQAQKRAPSPDPQLASAAPWERAESHLRRRDIDGAKRELDHARNELERTPNSARTPDQHIAAAQIMRAAAKVDRAEGRLDGAISQYQRALELLRGVGGDAGGRAAAAVALDLADTLHTADREAEARALFRSALEANRTATGITEREWRARVAETLLRYARFELARYQNEAARQALGEAGQHVGEALSRRQQIHWLLLRSDLAARAGDVKAARSTVAAARQGGPGSAEIEADINLADARVALAEGAAERALVLFTQAEGAYRARAAEFERRGELAQAMLGRAWALFALKRGAEARNHAGAAVAVLRAAGDRALAVTAQVQIALSEARDGDPAAAEKALAEALALQRGKGDLSAETISTLNVLCAANLRDSAVCRERVAPNPASPPER